MSKAQYEFKSERENALIREFYKIYIDSGNAMPLTDMLAILVKRPAPRFYVSLPNAVMVIRQMIRGTPPPKMRDNRRAMYEEILARVMRMVEQNPGITLRDAVDKVIEQPAPKFYITIGTASVLLCNARKHRKRKEIYAERYNK
jgi:hypothetical protein